ncbi:MAG: EAL domain-containing protein [Proteobacteria bacterium]|nr:EAL domain-containing protein [Pseudomonadota bacterium]MBU4295070.1 EAL domain-containing protein [Pseudomonadota bacterium]MCG2748061.1 EAL domain-containing protein [Desulfobulbaceae bacterium]
MNKIPEEQIVVLIVDDDMAQRLLMRETLHDSRLVVEEAANGVEALAAFERFSPDLVLMDVKMPKMDGFTACSRMRKLAGGQDAVIVLVTGLEDFASIGRAFDAGATDFITKPVNWPLLSHRVRYLLRAGRAFRNLRQSERRLSIAQNIASLGNWDWDIDKNSIYWSPQMYRIFGLPAEESTATNEVFLERVHPDERESVTDLVRKALQAKKPYSIDYRITLPDGACRNVHEQADVVHDEEGNPVSMQGTVQDITERINTEEKIRFLAYYDGLTGLPNRQLFLEHFNQALFAAQRDGSKVALLYLDLDRFKRINDTLGHSAGDKLLKSISICLADSIRSSDIVAKACFPDKHGVTLSRLGGDEFTILLTRLAGEEHAGRVAQRILDLLSQPTRIADQEVYISGSIGITLYPSDGEDVDMLLRNADVAMYHAKENGRNSFQYFSEQMNQRTMEKLSIETDLKKALERNELLLYYQPQIDLQTGKLAGVEALVRWLHPRLGMVPPSMFIPIAEEAGLIVELGQWVLIEACRQAVRWQKAGFAPLRMGVNISSLQFKHQSLAALVGQVLQQTGLAAGCLELELTESAIMQNVSQVNDTLIELKELGVNLSVDDFGTGYSSMSYLKRFPLDTLKIDRSFVMDITTDANDAAIIKAIIALGKSLGLKTIAEGVETAEQLAFLQEQRCDEIQGFFISRPLPGLEVEQYLIDGKKFC